MRRIVFFVKEGLDNFLGDIMKKLAVEYEIKKIVVTQYNQIDEGMKNADICWFEWCDELVSYGSKLEMAKEKIIICRLHSYEAFTDYINQVNWEAVNKLIFVGEHIRNIVLNKININKENTVVIPNGIDCDKYKYAERAKGFNVAYVGYINYKKGPMLLLHTFKGLYDKDPRYKLFIAGLFQDERYVLYLRQMIVEMGLENNVIYQGWQDDLNHWLEDKNYILCTSILESQNMSVMQAMCKGIKPIIHNFVGAKEIYEADYIWNTIDEAVASIHSDEYCSSEYAAFVKCGYSSNKAIRSLKAVIESLFFENKDESIVGGETTRKVEGESVSNAEIKAESNPLEKPESENLPPLVSICIPVYNGEKYINQAIITALQQSYENIEIIISDNCSTDETLKVIESFKDKRIKLYKNSSNEGYLVNLNKCLSYSKGKYIKYLFADDILDKDNVKDLTQIMEANLDVNFTANNFRQINGTNHLISGDLISIGEGKYEGNYIRRVLIMYGNIIGAPSNILIRKAAIDEVGGFSSEYEYMSDYHMWVSLAQVGSFYFFNKTLSYFRIHEDGGTAQKITSIARVRDFYKILKTFIDEKEFSKEDVKISYINATARSKYSLQNSNDLAQRLEIIDLILAEDQYLSDEVMSNLKDVRSKIVLEGGM